MDEIAWLNLLKISRFWGLEALGGLTGRLFKAAC